MNFRNTQRGFALIEMLIGLGIAAVFIVSFLEIVTQSKQVSRENMDDLVATLLLREAVEVTRDLELSDWDELETSSCSSSVCHPEPSGGVWTLQDGPQTIDGRYTRTLSIVSARRDQAGFPNTIVESGGVEDPDTKRVEARVAWESSYGTREKVLETYVYKFGN